MTGSTRTPTTSSSRRALGPVGGAGLARLGQPRLTPRLGWGCTPPPAGTTDPAVWKAYIQSCPKEQASSYVQSQLGVPVERYYHNGQIDLQLLAADLARKASGLPLADGCFVKPADMSGPELSAYALRCGQDAAADYVKSQTGIDPRAYVKDGKPDWAAVGGAVATKYFGTDVNFHTMFNPDGSINYQDVAGQAGGIAAAAVCTAYGAGAAAPVCGWLGNQLGRAIYSVGEAFIEFLGFGSDDDQRAAYVYHPTAEDAQRWTATWFAIRRPDYCRRILAIRGAAIAACGTALILRDAWNTATGEQLTVTDLLGKMFAAGMQLPAGWAGTIGSPPIPKPLWGGKYVYGDQSGGQSLSLLYDWQVAQRAFGQPPSMSMFDLPFIAKPITDKYLTGQERFMLFGFTDSSDPGGAALIWIVDPDGGPPPDPTHTAPGQWYTNVSATWGRSYVPAEQAMVRSWAYLPGSAEPFEVSIFDPRATDFGAIQVGCAEGERGAYNAQKKSSLPVSEACRQKIAAAWEAQFWVAPDQVQVAYNNDARFVAEHASAEQAGSWIRSIQTAASAVRRELEERGTRSAAKPAKSGLRVAVETTLTVAGVGAVALGAYRASQGLSIVPRSVRPAQWLK